MATTEPESAAPEKQATPPLQILYCGGEFLTLAFLLFRYLNHTVHQDCSMKPFLIANYIILQSALFRLNTANSVRASRGVKNGWRANTPICIRSTIPTVRLI